MAERRLILGHPAEALFDCLFDFGVALRRVGAALVAGDEARGGGSAEGLKRLAAGGAWCHQARLLLAGKTISLPKSIIGFDWPRCNFNTF
jgi:hypothetical protein